MNNEVIIEKAKEDFEELKKIVEEFKGSIDELCEKLKGYNLKNKLYFDVNFGLIKGMIYFDFKTKEIGVCEEVDIYDESEIIEKNFVMG